MGGIYTYTNSYNPYHAKKQPFSKASLYFFIVQFLMVALLWLFKSGYLLAGRWRFVVKRACGLAPVFLKKRPFPPAKLELFV